MSQYTLSISKKQAEIMEQALHSYSRMLVGQFNIALEPITWNFDVKDKLNETQKDWLNQLTIYEHNEMHGHTEESEIAWDIYQVLRHHIWKESPDRKPCVADSVCKRGSEELPTICGSINGKK